MTFDFKIVPFFKVLFESNFEALNCKNEQILLILMCIDRPIKKHIPFNFRCYYSASFYPTLGVDFCPVLLIISSCYTLSNPIINNLPNVQCAMQCAVMSEINTVWSVTAKRNFNLSLLMPSMLIFVEFH